MGDARRDKRAAMFGLIHKIKKYAKSNSGVHIMAFAVNYNSFDNQGQLVGLDVIAVTDDKMGPELLQRIHDFIVTGE